MIHAGIARRAFRRTANGALVFRAYTEVPGILNAMPDSQYQDTQISPAKIRGITEKEKLSAAGAWDEVQKVVTFEAQSVTGRAELLQGQTIPGDRVNIGGVLTNGVLEGGTDFTIEDKVSSSINGFHLLKLYIKAVR
jgi:hypothetical protein